MEIYNQSAFLTIKKNVFLLKLLKSNYFQLWPLETHTHTHTHKKKKKKRFKGLVMSVKFKETKQKQEQNLQRWNPL